MDPWGRPYMYRAYPQWAWVTGGVNGPGANQVTLTLGNLSGPAGYGSNPAFSVYNGYTYFGGYNFYTATNLTSTTGSIQLTGFGNPSSTAPSRSKARLTIWRATRTRIRSS